MCAADRDYMKAREDEEPFPTFECVDETVELDRLTLLQAVLLLLRQAENGPGEGRLAAEAPRE